MDDAMGVVMAAIVVVLLGCGVLIGRCTAPPPASEPPSPPPPPISIMADYGDATRTGNSIAVAQYWNDFAKERGLECISVEEAKLLTPRDVERMVLAVKAKLPEAAPQTPNHVLRRGAKMHIERQE
jgi:hypothetical protein